MMLRMFCVFLLMCVACGVSAGNPGGRGKLIVVDKDDKPALEKTKKVVWIDKRFPRGVRTGDEIHLLGKNLGEKGRVFVGDTEAEVQSWASKEVVVKAPKGVDAACTTVSMDNILLRKTDGSTDVTDAVSNHISIVAGKGDTWLPADDYPGARAQHVAIWTGKEMIVYGGGSNMGGRYNPSTDSWIAMSSVGAGNSEAGGVKAVWTGNEMIIISSNPAAYNPQTDTWRPLNPVGRPQFEGWAQSAVWTGSDVIIWGQVPNCGRKCPYGTRYSPSTDSYRSMRSFHGSVEHSAVWTGTEMIVWGGIDAEKTTALGGTVYPASGGRYNPEDDNWRPVSLLKAPSALRSSPAAFWTGSNMIVWGGSIEDGGIYDPANDKWQPISRINAPANDQHSVVWTGDDMLVWNGKTAGRYNPGKDAWSALSLTGSPAPRGSHTGIWTGQEMIVWGGVSESSWNFKFHNSGGRYNPKLDRWLAVDNSSDEPTGYMDMASVWSGSEMIVWGGSDRSNGFHDRAVATGARYSPTENHWKPIASAPEGRFRHSAIWNGTAMEIWGGSNKVTECDTTPCFVTGGLVPGGLSYSPQTDTWASLPAPIHMTSGTIKPHLFRTETGVLIWGGRRNAWEDETEGAVYNQIAGTWQATSEQGAPVVTRSVTTLVNDKLFVWGKVQNDEGTRWVPKGALYSIASDSWKPITTTSAPELNDEMVVSISDKVVLVGQYFLNADVSSIQWVTHLYDVATDSWQKPKTNNPVVGYTEFWPKAFSDGSRMIAVFQPGSMSQI